MSELTDNNGVSSSKYIAGFVLAVILTLLSFIPVMYGLLDSWTASAKVIYLIGLALIQIFVQIAYFLHLNHGPDANWKVGSMWFGAVATFVIIFGTWWAMQHLNYNMMGGSGRVVQPPVVNIAPAPAPEAVAPKVEMNTAPAEQAAPAVAPSQSNMETAPAPTMAPSEEATPAQSGEPAQAPEPSQSDMDNAPAE